MTRLVYIDKTIGKYYSKSQQATLKKKNLKHVQHPFKVLCFRFLMQPLSFTTTEGIRKISNVIESIMTLKCE